MGAYLQQILELLTKTPGNLAYHIVLTFSVVWALYASLPLYRSGSPVGRRMLAGLGLLLILRLALFTAAAAGGQDLLNGNLLPPIDRGLALLSLIVIIWLWAFPEPRRLPDATTLLLSVLALTLLVLAVLWWAQQGGGLLYNGSSLDRIGDGISLAVAVGGVILLARSRPKGWEFGVGMLTIIAVGHLVHLFLLPEQGNYSGAIRLAQAAAYPMLLLLSLRFLVRAGDATIETAPLQIHEGTPADSQLVEALLTLGGENDPDEICRGLTQAAARALGADICLLAYPTGENGEIIIPCGLDIIHEVDFSAFSIDSSRLPVVDKVLHMGHPVALHASSTSPDLVSLVQALNLNRAGPFLAAPVLRRTNEGEEKILAAIILLSPYSGKSWEGEQEAVMQVAGSLAQLLQHIQFMEGLQMDAEEARLSLEKTQAETEAARREREEAVAELLVLEELYRKEHAQLESLTALVKDHDEAGLAAGKNGEQASGLRASDSPTSQELTEKDQALAEANRLLEGALAEIALLKSRQKSLEKTEPLQANRWIGRDDLEGALQEALDELERMRAALVEAEQQTLAGGRSQQLAQLDANSRESLASLALDLRVPVTMLFHEVRSLLSGQGEALSEAQRSSLEEMKGYTQRVATMVDQMIRLSARSTEEEDE
jgi:hypothetical protein